MLDTYDDEEQKPRIRRAVTMQEIAVLITLLMNFSVIVWGAAVMSKSVDDLTISNDKIYAALAVVVSDVTNLKVDHTTRLRILENRLDRETAQ